MSIRFGRITQNGYVVPDIEAAMLHWAKVLGVGPWFYLGAPEATDVYYRGRPGQFRSYLAFANSGDLQIELIQPFDDEPSVYREFLQKTSGKGGLQHVSSWPSTNDYDRIKADFLVSGGEVAAEGRVGESRFSYFETSLDMGTMFEIADLGADMKNLVTMVREAAESWDGSDPVRRL